ncbi:MAG: hypothetical protein IPJ71_04180 [Bdellovibrionales bacterium]|nr:hypothetical protein [Bdellovibrionales bacterium]
MLKKKMRWTRFLALAATLLTCQENRAETALVPKALQSHAILRTNVRQVEQKNDACSTLQTRLRQLTDLSAQNGEDVFKYLADLGEIMGVWYQDLEPLEGNNVFIQKGSFAPIHNTSVNVTGSSQIVKRNSDELVAALKELEQELSGCLK